MSALMPLCDPLSSVTVRKSGVAAAAMISGRHRVEIRVVAQIEQLLEAAAAIGQRLLLLQLHLQIGEAGFQRVVLCVDAPEADVAAPRASKHGHAGRRAALHLGKTRRT